VLGAIFLGAAMLIVRNLSEQSERRGVALGAAVRARAPSPDAVPVPPEPATVAERADSPFAQVRSEPPSPSEPAATAEVAEPVPDPAPPERASGRDTARAAQLTRVASHALVKGDAQSALGTIERALQLDARYAPAWRGKGMILDNLGHTREAAEAYREFLKLRPSGEQADAIRKRLWQLSPR
jgi:tetratricopeptide (TPR) repeat protein